jgi:uncharacterized membrane protein
VVIQALFPEQDIVLERSAYQITAGESKAVPVFVYNFGAKKATGKLNVEAPERWSWRLPAELEVAPGERKRLRLELTCADTNNWTIAPVRITGDFGDDGHPLLSLQFTPATTK